MPVMGKTVLAVEVDESRSSTYLGRAEGEIHHQTARLDHREGAANI
jgi:hypothetical protein